MKALFLILILTIPYLFFAQTQSKYIVIDQFGYRPISEKKGMMRDPLTGFDASESFAPEFPYALVDATNNVQVFTGNSVPYKSGTEEASSGDRAWWLDFHPLKLPGLIIF